MEYFLPTSWSTITPTPAPAPAPSSPPPSVTGKRSRESTYQEQGAALTVEEILAQLTAHFDAIALNPELYVDIDTPRLRRLWTASLLQPTVPRKRVSRCAKKDWANSSWMLSLEHPELRTYRSHQYREFRTTYRMPPELFLDHFLPQAKAHNLFDLKYKSGIPLEIKLMIGLRVLGRGTVMADIEEMSGVPRSTCYDIFKDFLHGFSTKLYKSYVSPPTGPYLREVMDEYARLGFAGAVGSVDCTHVFWDKCPHDLLHLCKDRHTWPSLTFEAVVDHSRRIHSCSEAFYGTTADPTVAAADPYVSSILEGQYRDVEYSLYDLEGDFTTVRGGYLIADNGYPNSWMYAKPQKHRFDPKGVYWSEFLESIRKDVERTFGILKKRFVFLKNANQYHDGALIGQAMWTACGLHNMILDYDKGLKEEVDYAFVDWAVLDAAEAGDEVAIIREANNDIYEEGWVAEKAAPGSGMGIIPATNNAPVIRYEPRKYAEIMELLIDHFKYSFERGSVVWSQGFSVDQRLHFPMRKKSVSICTTACTEHLPHY
jgi:hypothetical protein